MVWIGRRWLRGRAIWLDYHSNGRPKKGVLGVADLFLYVAAQREYRFQLGGVDNSLVYLEIPGKGKKLVAVRVQSSVDDDSKIVNPLAALSASEIRGLQGVLLRVWNKKVLRRLQYLDPRSTCISLEPESEDRPAPALPDVRCLIVLPQNSPGLKDLVGSNRHRKLQYLEMIERNYGRPFDVRQLARLRSLRALTLIAKVENVSHLSKLTMLRHLQLASSEGITNLGFLRSLRFLRSVDLSDTKVTDLSPLGLNQAQKNTLGRN